MREQLQPHTSEQRGDMERLLDLARRLGSEKNIGNQAIVFDTKAEADAFKDFCAEEKLAVVVREKKAEGEQNRVTFEVAVISSGEKETARTPQEQPLTSEQKERTPENARARFERNLKGKFAHVARGTFSLTREPFTSIVIVPNEASGRITLNATLFYKTADGRDTHATWSLFEDGAFSGRIPKDLPVARDDIFNEVLSAIEAMNIRQWYKTELDIIPEHDQGEESGAKGGKKEGEPRAPIDPTRLRELERLRGFVFGFVNDRKGFDGYRGALVTGARTSAVVLDCEWVDNAGFVVPLDIRIEARPGSLDKEEVTRILEEAWKPISDRVKTRKQLLETVPSSVRLVHAGHWQARMRDAITRLID